MYSSFQVKLSFINMEKTVFMVSSKISNPINKKKKKKRVKYRIYLCKREREREREFSFIPCPFGEKIIAF